MSRGAAGSRGKENHALAAVVGLTRDAPLCLVAGGIETRAPLRFSLSSTGLDVRDALARTAQADPDGIDRPERRAAPDAESPTDRPDHAGQVAAQASQDDPDLLLGQALFAGLSLNAPDQFVSGGLRCSALSGKRSPGPFSDPSPSCSSSLHNGFDEPEPQARAAKSSVAQTPKSIR